MSLHLLCTGPSGGGGRHEAGEELCTGDVMMFPAAVFAILWSSRPQNTRSQAQSASMEFHHTLEYL